MLSRLTNRALTLAGWFSLAYLGYWTALLLDRVLVQLPVYFLLRARTIHWSVSSFRVSIEAPELFFVLKPISPSLGLTALPLLIEAALLLFLARRYSPAKTMPAPGQSVGLASPFLRTGLHFVGLWIVLLLALHTALLAYAGFGQLAHLIRLFRGPGSIPVVLRIGLAAFVGVPLLAAGVMCARRLLSNLTGAMQNWLPRWAHFPIATLLLILPVQLILLGFVGGSLSVLRGRTLLTFLVPGGFCLLLALLSLLKNSASLPAAALGTPSAALACALAAVLCAGLGSVEDARRWLNERHFARFSSEHYEILYADDHLNRTTVRAFAEERERMLSPEAARLGVTTGSHKFRLVLYSDFPSKRLATSSDRPFTVEGTTIRAVLGGYLDRVDPAADAAALLNAVWGKPGTPLLGDWVARWLAGDWRGRPPAEWAAQITSEEGHLALADLLDPAADRDLSPLVRHPLGAAWVGLVFERYGLEGVHRLYAKAPQPRNLAAVARSLKSSADQLEQDWKNWIAAQQAQLAQADPPSQPRSAAEFFRGVSFSHEGWSSGRGGYDSPEALQELQQLRALGVNALAAIPYGFVRDASDLTISYTGADESDEQLTQLLYVARHLGMKVLLKPQIWVPWAKFTGEIRFDDPMRRTQWMRSYRRFILHYARLAELEGFDLFSIGNEFGGLTPHEDDWRRLIADVRRVYRGPVTYAANWGEEFESVRFWDALDYIGLNNYYPLRPARERPSGQASPVRVEDLLPGAQALATRIEAVSQKWQRPVLFTEAGYPSVREGTAEPWLQGRGRGIGLEEQAAGYEAVFQAFAGRPWFRGMFWWKWPSNGRGGGPDDPNFTPRGKPAAEVLRAWYTRLAGAQGARATQAP